MIIKTSLKTELVANPLHATHTHALPPSLSHFTTEASCCICIACVVLILLRARVCVLSDLWVDGDYWWAKVNRGLPMSTVQSAVWRCVTVGYVSGQPVECRACWDWNGISIEHIVEREMGVCVFFVMFLWARFFQGCSKNAWKQD